MRVLNEKGDLIAFTGPLTEMGVLKRGLFEDLRHTFDTVNYSIFLSKLDLYGIGNKENQWFRSNVISKRKHSGA